MTVVYCETAVTVVQSRITVETITGFNRTMTVITAALPSDG
jgi:hypothetical protein